MTIFYPVPERFPDSRARFIQIMNTCHSLAEKGCEVRLITGYKSRFTTDEILNFYNIHNNGKLKLIRLPMLRMESSRLLRVSWHGLFHWSLLFYLVFLRSEPENKAVIFIRHVKLTNFLLSWRRIIKYPFVFEAHESLAGNDVHKDDFCRRKLKRLDALIFISKELEDYTVTNCRDINTKPRIVAHDGVREKWLSFPAETEREYICYTGNFYDWKGIDVLISAMQYLPDERLLIIGGGKRLSELKAIVKEKGFKNISFAGEVPHRLVPSYLARAKAAVLPNIDRGPSAFSSPLKLFEYMALGIPVVASDLRVFGEVLIHKNNSILVKPDNAKALASGIGFLMKNPSVAELISKQAKKDVMEFTYEKRADRILNLINSIS